MQFSNKIAIVTGATGGLGGAVVEMLLGERATVVGTYTSTPGVEALVTLLGAAADGFVPLAVDVTDEANVEQMAQTVLDRFGRIDFLVNLVGGWAGGRPAYETDLTTWQRMLDLNLQSAFLCCRAAIPAMITENFGRIVNVASRTAVQPAAGQAAYAVSKAGVITLTEALALELREHDITVNAILPSVIDTPANRQMMPRASFDRWVKPAEIARVIRFLLSDDARVISGAAIPVYGKA